MPSIEQVRVTDTNIVGIALFTYSVAFALYVLLNL